jgi:hypothetical protein
MTVTKDRQGNGRSRMERRMPSCEQQRPRLDSLLLDGDLKPRAVDHTITANTDLVTADDPLKQGRYGSHLVYSDEPPTVGGHDQWPPPPGYAALAIGF